MHLENVQCQLKKNQTKQQTNKLICFPELLMFKAVAYSLMPK